MQRLNECQSQRCKRERKINIEKISRECLKILAVVNTMEFQFIVVIQT